MPLIVGLTGGVASGKSEAGRRFSELGVPVLDADHVARELVEPGTAALGEIVAQFGAGMLDPGGRLDRRRMRQLVFEDAEARRRLERILHPRIESRLHALALDARYPYVVVAIPLLAEVGRYPWLDRVVVVDASEALQAERLQARDGIGAAEAERLIAAQAGRATRLALADEVLRNEGDRDALRAAVDALHRRLLDASGAPSP